MTLVAAYRAAVLVATCLAFCVPASAQPQTITPVSLEEATSKIRGLCLERVCLGMTVLELNDLGRLQLLSERPFDDAIGCSDKMGARVTRATLTTPDGVEFLLTLSAVTRTGFPGSRYRVTVVTLRLGNATDAQVVELTDSVLRRFGITKAVASDTWGDVTADDQYDVLIKRYFQAPGKSAALTLLAGYRHYADWLASLPECRGGLPRP